METYSVRSAGRAFSSLVWVTTQRCATYYTARDIVLKAVSVHTRRRIQQNNPAGNGSSRTSWQSGKSRIITATLHAANLAKLSE